MNVRLHLGCGLVHRPDWINVDRYTAAAADLLADAVLLPFPDSSAETVEALQLIEHLGYVGALYGLYEWARVLAPSGLLHIETPDRDATLRAALSPDTAAAARPWLFGMEQRGLAHRYLFSASELPQMVAKAGFEAVTVEHITTRPAHPTLRLTARRAADTPGARFAARLHRAFVTAGIVDLSDTPQYLRILETVCERAAQLIQTPGSETLIQLMSLSARYSPRLAACILRTLPASPAWPDDELDRARRLTADLEREQFPARLACRWRAIPQDRPFRWRAIPQDRPFRWRAIPQDRPFRWRAIPKLPTTAGVAWTLLEREISLYLTARLYPGEGLDEMRANFDTATADLSPSDRSVDFFCREALSDAARRLTARGVRAFARGSLERAAQAFEAAIAYDPDLAWPRWNLARLHAREGRYLRAVEQYEALQANLRAIGMADLEGLRAIGMADLEGLRAIGMADFKGLRPAFEREMDAIVGRGGDVDTFTVPLADPADLLGEIK